MASGLHAAREDSPCQLGAVHTWHDATVGYDAPIQSLLKVERTCRQRRAQIDPTLLTQSEWTPELAIIRSGAYRISSRLNRNGVLEMTTNVLVAFYSTYGHVHRMALAVADGAESVPDTTVRLRRIAELEEARKALSAQEAYVRAQQVQADIPAVTHDDLRWADGIAWGTPTRYGNMSAQMKHFVDTTGGLWLKGELEDKATGIFTSTGTIHGGQETTILTALVPLIHLGMVFVGTPYGQNPQLLVTDGIGGSPYGPGTLAGTDGSRQPVEAELTTARNLGSRLARVAGRLKDLRVSRASAP
jgi:NAD(P)H dehydrogenase (quinone)